MKKIWKKYMAIMLAAIITIAPGVNVYATSADVPEENVSKENAPGVNVSEENASKENVSEESISDGTNSDSINSDSTNLDNTNLDNTNSDSTNAKEDSSDKKIEADIIQGDGAVNADIYVDTEADDHVVIAEDDKPYLALGANLSEEQRNTVLNLMGIDPANLDQYNVVTVTNEEEHQYLDGYLDSSTIGTKALSSVVIVKREKGDGLNISTKNISYCTIGMYKNALATAGLEDADIIVAGPFPLSGTAALIGAMKAYADMENADVDAESLDAAMNEIVVTGELNDRLGGKVQTEEFIAYVKKKVVEGGLEDREKIRDIIAEASDKFQISLNDNEKEKITSLMEKIGSLDINIDSLVKQAGSIYESLKEMEKSSGILSSIANFFKKIVEWVIQFFQGLF